MHLSLKLKLVLSSVLLILITILVLGGVSYQTLDKQAWSAIESESQNTAKAYSQGIGDWFHDRQNSVSAQ